MPIKEFPFLSLTPDGVERPWLPVRIINPHTNKFVSTFGLIDTGADECTVPADFASELDHCFDKGKPKNINTAGGITTAYSHTTIIEIYQLRDKKVIYKIPETPVDFTSGLSVVLLGVSSFLDQCKLEINYPKKHFSIIRPRQ